MLRARFLHPEALPLAGRLDFARARQVRQLLGEGLWATRAHVRQRRDPALARFPSLGAYERPFDPGDYLPAWLPAERTDAVVYDEIHQLPANTPLGKAHLLANAPVAGRALADTFFELHESLLHLSEKQRGEVLPRLARTLAGLPDVPAHTQLPYTGDAPLDELLSACRAWFLQEYLPPALLHLAAPLEGEFTRALQDSYHARLRHPWLSPTRPLPPPRPDFPS